jgi:hypothetical protein
MIQSWLTRPDGRNYPSCTKSCTESCKARNTSFRLLFRRLEDPNLDMRTQAAGSLTPIIPYEWRLSSLYWGSEQIKEVALQHPRCWFRGLPGPTSVVLAVSESWQRWRMGPPTHGISVWLELMKCIYRDLPLTLGFGSWMFWGPVVQQNS